MKCLNEWNIAKGKIMVVVSDNGENITKTEKDSFGNFKYVPSFSIQSI